MFSGNHNFSSAMLFALISDAKQERKQEREAQARRHTVYHYMNAREQWNALLIADHGGIYRNIDGTPVTGTFLYVVLEDNRLIHVSDTIHNNNIRYRHSCLANGKKVRAAGKIVLEEGRLIIISNESGHYKPPGENMCQIISHFTRESHNPRLIFQDHTNAALGLAYEYAAIDFVKGHRDVLKKISVNDFVTTDIDDDLYTTEGVRSRFAGKPKLIQDSFFAPDSNINTSEPLDDIFTNQSIDKNKSEERGRCCRCTIF